MLSTVSGWHPIFQADPKMGKIALANGLVMGWAFALRHVLVIQADAVTAG